jgi:hypothetical protein
MADSLWLDSSVLRLGAAKKRELAEKAQEKGVRLLVHPHIHLEMCRYYRESRRKQGKSFEASYVRSSLEQLRIEVATFVMDRDVAETWAERLDQRYPTDEEWQQAKQVSVRARLPEQTKIRAAEVPMTTDWLVALEVEEQGAFIAVGDKGEEWASLRSATPRRAMTYAEAIVWLSEKPQPESAV